jgi:type VI secretion system Hcp family effector
MFNAFLKIEGVKGEATQEGFKEHIPLDSFSLGASNPVDMMSGGGRGAGRVSVSTFNAGKMTDKSSPILFQACCVGKHFPNAEVSICKAGGEQKAFLTYKFDTVFIADINWSGGGGDDTPAETLSLAFSKIEMTHLSQDMKGQLGDPIVASYDIAAATAG